MWAEMKTKWQHSAEEGPASKESNEEENDNTHSCMQGGTQ